MAEIISFEVILSLGIAGIGISGGLLRTYVKFLRKIDSMERQVRKNKDHNKKSDKLSIERILSNNKRDDLVFQTQVRTALKII